MPTAKPLGKFGSASILWIMHSHMLTNYSRSNAAAWWGYQARVKTVDGRTFTAGSFSSTPESYDEVVTIYEFVHGGEQEYAVPLYQFQWPTVTEQLNTTRDYIAYPGTCIPHDDHGALRAVATCQTSYSTEARTRRRHAYDMPQTILTQCKQSILIWRPLRP